MWIIFVVTVLFFALLLLIGMTYNPVFGQEAQPVINKRQSEKLLAFIPDTALAQTKAEAMEQYKALPPLSPERFRRRVKMILGVDVLNYPDNALIWFGGYDDGAFTLSVKYQTISGVWHTFDDDPFPLDLYAIYKMFQPLRGYLFYNDSSAYHVLDNYAQNLYESLHKEKSWFDITVKYVIIYAYDIIAEMFNFNMSTQPKIIHTIDSRFKLAILNHTSIDLYKLNIWISNKLMPVQVSNIKKDLVSLFIMEQMRKGRRFGFSEYDAKGRRIKPTENEIWVDKSNIHKLGSLSDHYDFDEREKRPWKINKRERNAAAYLSFLVQLQDTSSNKFVIQYLSGQLDRYLTGGSGSTYRMMTLDTIRSNNYYGYAVLREFCENPEREMPTLEKVGTSFKGTVNKDKSLLYLEPFPDSYDIDTIRTNETFIAYEMGHDDYYFVEVVKPVESPIAGPDGYAMILDRTETVYGYMKRAEVREYTDADKLSQTISAANSKQGVIIDPDGFVNIRKEMNTQSAIQGKIVEKEIFDYWEVPNSNWCAVKTRNGILGFVYKDRIREKLDTGGWTILDDD